ncbi:MAG: DUF4869 domain-containing protein [Clostridia bacterium]|nr:DUF4869 domain-containing protein [Clostridia bacterium]
MLHIVFGDLENVNHGPSWFKANYSPEWLKAPFVQEMILDVDKSRYVDGLVIDSPVFGPIPPERLSGGVMTLIMIYEKPDLVFNATSCGGNCAKWLLKIGSMKDVTVNLRYLMPFEKTESLELFIENEGRIVHGYRDYLCTAIKYV